MTTHQIRMVLNWEDLSLEIIKVPVSFGFLTDHYDDSASLNEFEFSDWIYDLYVYLLNVFDSKIVKGLSLCASFIWFC